MPLTADQFPAFFHALWGHEPFPWQAALAARVCRGEGWPQGLPLPTGAGKTAALDIAVFHLALEATRGAGRSAPCRVAFVVDRRLVVDGTHDRACRMASALERAESGILLDVAARLRHLAGPGAPPLEVVRLRGGVPKEPDWARSPCQPTILVSTIDQVGSRLLFRGYGVSESMRPVHAGLLGTDCLYLVDEAHLARPFVQTLEAVAHHQGDPTRFGVVRLTATPAEAAFPPLTSADEAHPVLGPRLRAAKPASLRLAKTGLAEVFRDAAREVAAGASVVGVVVNRVALARRIHTLLREAVGDAADVELLIGRVRPLDREEHLAALLPRVQADPGRQPGGRPLFLVATQTVEVGADLDFDALVTQIAPLDSLRQRFGRLDRLGQRGESKAIVLASKDDIGKKVDDPLYGSAMAATWTWLQDQAVKDVVDFGLSALPLPDADTLAPLLAPTLDAPLLLAPHVDLLAQTSPAPGADPEVALFLHGPRKAADDVRVVWRADIAEDPTNACIGMVEAVPPLPEEALSLPLATLRHWLAGGQGGETGEDIEGRGLSKDRPPHAAPGRAALRWTSEGAGKVEPGDIRPGDTIILSARLGGCDAWGWTGRRGDGPVPDLSTRAWTRRGRPILRLHPNLIDPENWPALRRLLDTEDRPEAAAMRPFLPDDLREALDALGPYDRQNVDDLDATILRARKAEATATEDDRGSFQPRPVGLTDHLRHVHDRAAHFARALDLKDADARAVTLAAGLHDAGKAEPRFQIYLHGGDELAALVAEVPLAKSGLSQTTADRRRARVLARLPRRPLHEAWSVRLAETHPAVAALPEDERDLVLWLIGTHHGNGRPFFPAVEDPHGGGSVGLDLDGTALEVPAAHGLTADPAWWARFARLNRRLGPWRLAALEAVVRLADHRASEQEQQEDAP